LLRCASSDFTLSRFYELDYLIIIMPSESKYPKIDIPDVDLWGFLFERKDRPFGDDKGMFSSDNTFFNSTWDQHNEANGTTVIYFDPYTKRSYTYAQVRDAAANFGKGLKHLWDWQKGDVLALYTPNCIDTPAITWGCHWAGGILSPANPNYSVDELVYQLKDSGARAIVTQMPFIENAQEAAKQVGIPLDKVIVMGDQRDPSHKVKHFTSIVNTAGSAKYRRTKAKNPAEDLAFLVYSSGTTGTTSRKWFYQKTYANFAFKVFPRAWCLHIGILSPTRWC
jgi:4-coumarate--CoA ligase